LGWAYVVRRTDAKAEFYISTPDIKLNLKRFQSILAKKEDIEASFGEPLEWDSKDSRKAQMIRSWTKLGGLENEDKWREIENDLVDRMVRLEKALRDYIASLP
ncbi:MAG TPA: DUF4268 domain-containing protein, partial [Desulfobaccales bacterium]